MIQLKTIINSIRCFINIHILIFSLLISSGCVFGNSITVITGDSNETAKTKLINALQQGGQITFEEGVWTINLTSNQSKFLKDLTIVGANINPGNFNRGAFENSSQIKTTLIFTGARFSLTKDCQNLSISNIQWKQVGISVSNRHLPNVDFSNVIFDLTDAVDAFVDKQIIRALDGIQGNIKNVSFRGFATALAFNRSLSKGIRPVETRGTLIIDQCLFNPDEDKKNPLSTAFTGDAGNDEHPVVWNQGGSEIKNSYLIDCRLALSKCSNFKFNNNICEIELSKKEFVHLEEFTNNIEIKGNTFKLLGINKRNNVITVGAEQSSYNLLIEDNTVEQTERLGSFVTGAGVRGITIKGNTILNPEVGKDNYVNFWSCNNTNIIVEPGQPGLDASHVNIDTGTCSEVFKEGTYNVVYNTNEYLGVVNGEVLLVQKSTAPTEANFLWNVLEHDTSSRNNFHSFQNVATKKYLQVRKGPNASESRSGEGEPYTLFRETVIGTTEFDFDPNIGWVPGFTIFKDNNTYALLPAGNEKRSQIKGDNGKVIVHITRNESNAEYNWSFIEQVNLSTSSLREKVSQIKIYPNPVTSGNLHISFPFIEEVIDIKVFNILGSSVFFSSFLDTKKLELNISNVLKPGVYFVQLSGNGFTKTQKLVIN